MTRSGKRKEREKSLNSQESNSSLTNLNTIETPTKCDCIKVLLEKLESTTFKKNECLDKILDLTLKLEDAEFELNYFKQQLTKKRSTRDVEVQTTSLEANEYQTEVTSPQILGQLPRIKIDTNCTATNIWNFRRNNNIKNGKITKDFEYESIPLTNRFAVLGLMEEDTKQCPSDRSMKENKGNQNNTQKESVETLQGSKQILSRRLSERVKKVLYHSHKRQRKTVREESGMTMEGSEGVVKTNKKTLPQKKEFRLLTDSHGHGLSELLAKELPDFDCFATIFPNATLETLVKKVPEITKNMKMDDILLIMAGTNDIDVNPRYNPRLSIHSICSNEHPTKVIIVSVPRRYDDPNFIPFINEVNKKIEEVIICQENFNHLYIKLNRMVRKDFTRHGLHFNRYGKQKLCDLIKNRVYLNYELKSGHQSTETMDSQQTGVLESTDYSIRNCSTYKTYQDQHFSFKIPNVMYKIKGDIQPTIYSMEEFPPLPSLQADEKFPSTKTANLHPDNEPLSATLAIEQEAQKYQHFSKNAVRHW